MAEPLVNQFGPEIPRRIGAMLAAVGPFDSKAFVATALRGYAALNLMQRGAHIADALQQHLPAPYPVALRWLLASLDHTPANIKPVEGSLASFLYLPHTLFVARHGLDHFELSMQAQHQLTQRFTAEFSLRPFLERYPQACLARLHEWAQDPSEHVRRLVSEGTRPRLPWAPRLRAFANDPAATLALLEQLKDDPSLYVRRSVANHLNDIGKDHPRVLINTARQWLQDADDARTWIIRHALRSAVKRAEPAALELLGYGHTAQVQLEQVDITPGTARIGRHVRIAFALRNATRTRQPVLVDFRIHYRKAHGKTAPKVFKLKQVNLAAGETMTFAKTVSLAQMTTRTHYPGQHVVELLVNGTILPLGEFKLLA